MDPVEPAVVLVVVDDEVLERLVAVAVADAGPDDVTPPLGEGWTAERVAWLQRFHVERRAGLAGPASEATWAVVAGGRVVGAVRLQRTAEPGVLVTGIWLARSARRRGVGRAALTATVAEARRLGARALCADTTAANAPALGLLAGAGFRVTVDLGSDGRDHGARRARLDLPGRP